MERKKAENEIKFNMKNILHIYFFNYLKKKNTLIAIAILSNTSSKLVIGGNLYNLYNPAIYLTVKK